MFGLLSASVLVGGRVVCLGTICSMSAIIEDRRCPLIKTFKFRPKH